MAVYGKVSHQKAWKKRQSNLAKIGRNGDEFTQGVAAALYISHCLAIVISMTSTTDGCGEEQETVMRKTTVRSLSASSSREIFDRRRESGVEEVRRGGWWLSVQGAEKDDRVALTWLLAQGSSVSNHHRFCTQAAQIRGICWDSPQCQYASLRNYIRENILCCFTVFLAPATWLPYASNQSEKNEDWLLGTILFVCA